MRDRRLTRKDDRGSVLIIVSVFSLIAVLLLGAVVDLGNQRAEKKRVTMSTDASALAAAGSIDFRGSYAKGVPVDCALVASTDGPSVSVADVAVQYWTQNGGSGPLDCTIVIDAVQPSTAYVTVSAIEGVDYAFGGATGQTSGSVTGSSSARVAAARGGLLYPVGLCTEGAEAALDQAGPGGRFATAHPTTVTFDAACGGSGNKRQIQFDVGLRGDSCGGVGMWCWDFNNGGYDGNGSITQIVESDTGKDWQKAEARGRLLGGQRRPSLRARAMPPPWRRRHTEEGRDLHLWDRPRREPEPPSGRITAGVLHEPDRTIRGAEDRLQSSGQRRVLGLAAHGDLQCVASRRQQDVPEQEGTAKPEVVLSSG